MKALTYSVVKTRCENLDIALISKKYVSAKEPLKVKCKKCGRIWTTTGSRIQQGKGCSKCARNAPLSSQHLQNLLDKKGDILKSEYVNYDTPVIVQCGREGHVLFRPPSSIIAERECRKCAAIKRGAKRKRTLRSIENLLRIHHFTLMELTYPGCKQDIHIRCDKCGRIFLTTMDKLQHSNKFKCKYCTHFTMESVSRAYMEYILKMPFDKGRPGWLINQDGHNLHLDGYNKESAIAFEYNGRQHREYDPYFHKSIEEFNKRCRDDRQKVKLCSDNQVQLIIIPDKIPMSKIGNFIQAKLVTVGLAKKQTLPKLWLEVTSGQNDQMLEKVLRNARIRNWIVKSKAYIGCREYMDFICDRGHDVQPMNANNFLSGKGCKECKKENLRALFRKPLSYYKELAKSKGGKCLTILKDYINCKALMWWECEEGHKWPALGDYITQGNWCPFCYNGTRAQRKHGTLNV